MPILRVMAPSGPFNPCSKMRLSPASVLILTMFCSFTVILTVMVLLFRPVPGDAPHRVARPQTPKPSPARPTADSTAHIALRSRASDTGRTPSAPPHRPERKRPPAPPSRRPAPGGRLQRRLEQEREEMRRLESNIQRHLREQLALQNRKLMQLARTCEALQPGEAVQILRELDDETVAEVLRRLEPASAGKIAALLKRLGRGAAVPPPYR